METRVNVIFAPSETCEQIGKFELSIVTDSMVVRKVGIKFDIKDLWSFAKDTNSVAFDFLVLSMLVYNVDRALNRSQYSEDGWRRNIQLMGVPVVNLEELNAGRDALNHAISFLTGDTWNIHFVQGGIYNYNPTNCRSFNVQDFEKVSLFSGGLDSLIGFVDAAHSLGMGKKVLLVSHKELGKEGNDQKKILEYCATNNILNGKYDRLLINVGLKKKYCKDAFPTESTFRSRSLLFFAAGLYAAHGISSSMPLIVPENGTISINIPLDKGRRSACSTRTTHPTFIKRLQEALSSIGIKNNIYNPYRLKSKADMMLDMYNDLAKKADLQPLVALSCSCAKRGHNRFWDKSGSVIHQLGITHCGMCLPCLYRRVSLDVVGEDNLDALGTDVLHGVQYDISRVNQKRTHDFRALLYFLKCRCNEKTIRQELLMNGVTNPNELNEYVTLAMHSYDQVRTWLMKNADDSLKRMAGIVC